MTKVFQCNFGGSLFNGVTCDGNEEQHFIGETWLFLWEMFRGLLDKAMDGKKYDKEDDHCGTNREVTKMEFNDMYEQFVNGDRMIGNLHPCCKLQMVMRIVTDDDMAVEISRRHTWFGVRSCYILEILQQGLIDVTWWLQREMIWSLGDILMVLDTWRWSTVVAHDERLLVSTSLLWNNAIGQTISYMSLGWR